MLAMDRIWPGAEYGHLGPVMGLRDQRVVTIGGGTGPFALLSTLSATHAYHGNRDDVR